MSERKELGEHTPERDNTLSSFLLKGSERFSKYLLCRLKTYVPSKRLIIAALLTASVVAGVRTLLPNAPWVEDLPKNALIGFVTLYAIYKVSENILIGPKRE